MAPALYAVHATSAVEDFAMDLSTWMPGMLILGLLALGLMVLFVEACDRV